MTQLIGGLSDIADRYDAILCDVWGVIHNGRESFAPACDALARFAAGRGPVVLISNAPRPSSAVVSQLDALGVPRTAWSAFVTSGDATRDLLRQRTGPVWAIGPERDRPLFDGLELQFAEADEAAFICCTGPYDDETEKPEDYVERLRGPAQRGLEFVCANPDRVVQRGDSLIYCAGAIADVYAALGGPVTMVGKPFAPIYDLARGEALRLVGRPNARLLAVGDGVPTDVRGANNQGLDLLFLARGIHAAEIPLPLDVAGVDDFLKREGASTTWAADELRW